MTTFKTWTPPATGQVRIYISGLAGQRSAKVFATACAADSFGFEYDIRAQVPEGVYVRSADLINAAEEAIFAAANCRAKTFEQVLALAAD